MLKSGELIYTDATVSFIIDGSLIDAKTRKNVTQARMAQLIKIDFATLPSTRPSNRCAATANASSPALKTRTAATASASPKTCRASRRHHLHLPVPHPEPRFHRENRRTSGAPRTGPPPGTTG